MNEQLKSFDLETISLILDSCVNGITISDPNQPDNPIIYANQAFERITGYSVAEILGRNCRFLQRDDVNQENLHKLREAMAKQIPIEVELRNYKKNGQLFYNFISVSPIFKEGKLAYFLGLQYDITKQVLAAEELKRLNNFLEEYIRHP